MYAIVVGSPGIGRARTSVRKQNVVLAWIMQEENVVGGQLACLGTTCGQGREFRKSKPLRWFQGEGRDHQLRQDPRQRQAQVERTAEFVSSGRNKEVVSAGEDAASAMSSMACGQRLERLSCALNGKTRVNVVLGASADLRMNLAAVRKAQLRRLGMAKARGKRKEMVRKTGAGPRGDGAAESRPCLRPAQE